MGYQHGTSNNTNDEERVQREDDGGNTNASGKDKSFEDVYIAIGPFGRYHFIQLAMILIINVPMVFLNLKYVYISQEPSFACKAVNDTELFKSLPADQGPYNASYEESCDIEIFRNESGKQKLVKSIDCAHGYDFEGGDGVSFITEWGLVCDDVGIPQLTQTVFTLGGFAGQVLVNIIGDKVGRWLTITASILITCGADIATAFVPDIYSMIGVRAMTGLVASGMYVCAFVLPFEMIVEEKRTLYSMISGMTWSLVVVILAGVGYAFRDYDWRDFQLYSGIIALCPLVCMYFVNESPSWLQSVGQQDRAEKIVKQACKINNVDYNKEAKETLDECFENIKNKSADASDENQTKSYTVLDLFRNKRYFVIVLVTWFTCFTMELTTNGLYITASTLAGDLYLNTALLGLVSIFSYVVSWGILHWKGRRFVIILFTLMSGTCILISSFVANADIDSDLADNLSLAFFVLGKFAISSSYNTLYLYIPEVYPTSVRASGMGVSTSGAPFGGAIAPYLLPLGKAVSWAPGVALCGCCLLTSVLFTRLPETKGVQMSAKLDAGSIDKSDSTKEMKVFSVDIESSQK